jgi:hypothetical protein
MQSWLRALARGTQSDERTIRVAVTALAISVALVSLLHLA